MEPASGNWVKVIFALLALALVTYFLFSIGEIVKIVVISSLLAYILEPVAAYIESRGMGRLAATAIIFSAILASIAVGVFIILPGLAREIESFQSLIRSGHVAAFLDSAEHSIVSRLSVFGIREINLAGRVTNASTHMGEWFFDHILDLVSIVTNLVIIPFVVFFLMKDGHRMKRGFIRLVPNRYFEFTLTLLHKMDQQMGNFLRGQFLDALIFGAMSTTVLWLLGVKYFLLIGVFAGLANLIPFLGPIAGATPAVIISLFDTGSPAAAFSVMAAFAGIKLVDDVIVQPTVVAKSVDMHPVMVLLAVLAGGKLFGLLGMLLSVPATGFIKIVVRESVSNFRRYNLA